MSFQTSNCHFRSLCSYFSAGRLHEGDLEKKGRQGNAFFLECGNNAVEDQVVFFTDADVVDFGRCFLLFVEQNIKQFAPEPHQLSCGLGLDRMRLSEFFQ